MNRDELYDSINEMRSTLGVKPLPYLIQVYADSELKLLHQTYSELISADEPNEYLKAADWAEFRAAGLLWWVNQQLHLFGWALTLNISEGKVIDVYPARTLFRGFSTDVNDAGYKNLTTHVASNIKYLKEAFKGDDSK